MTAVGPACFSPAQNEILQNHNLAEIIMTQQGTTESGCNAFNFDRTNLSFRAVQASQEQHIKDRAAEMVSLH